MGTAQDLQRWQRVLLATVVSILVGTGVVAYVLVQQLRDANQSVSYEHAERVIDAAGMETAFFERSAAARGYLLSGDPLFLENRAAATAALARRLESLRTSRVDAESLDDVEALLGRLDAASNRAMAARATSADNARSTWENEVRPVQEQLSKIISELATVERVAFAGARDRAADAAQRSAMLLALLLGGVATLVTVLFYGYTRATRALLARQAAEQNQATFRLLDQIPVGVFVLNAKGTPYYANQHAQKLLGRGITRSAPDRLSETYQVFEAGTERLYPSDRLPIVRALAGEVSECTDMEIRHGEDVVPLHVVGAPVYDAQGDLLYAVAGFQDVRELQRVAMRDTLTGLANRAVITQVYARERAVSARGKLPFSVALVDLDRFKAVNDLHGHASGDEVLKRTAATLVASLRRSDAVGRWGGEEFAVLLPNTDAIGAARALEKVLADVSAQEFVGKDRVRFSITFSAGGVIAAPSESLEEVIARADVLLYEAKSAGRNRVIIGPA